MVVFIQIFNQRWCALSFNEHEDRSALDIKRRLRETKGIPDDDIYLTHNGYILEDESRLDFNQSDFFIQCHLRLPGGKGGFGSMLRAIGAQIEKTTNREACRDLSGRRMRDVNDEKKIADWLSKQAERDQERARRKQERFERLQTAPKHVFEESTTYTTQLQENMDSIDDALQKGLKSSSSGQSSSCLGKRKIENRKKSHKKQKLWHEIDEDLSSDSDEESDTKSSCSSMADSDYSVSESSSKGSCTTTTSEPQSGCTSENENSVENPSLRGESPAQSSDTNSEAKLQLQKGQMGLSQEQVDKPGAEREALVSKETSSSDNYALTKSKIKDTKSIDNTTKAQDDSCDIKSEDCSSSESTGSITGIEKKCDDSEKGNKSPSNSVTLPLNLEQYNSTAELEELGLDVLKSTLMSLGMKCGGTLQQRAERLFSVKGIPREKVDPLLIAKPSGKKGKKR